MKDDLISREDMKKALTNAHINMELTFDISTFNCVMNIIDNAPTVKTYCYFCGQTEHGQIEERPSGECKTCKHYKPYRNTWGETRGDGYCSIKRMTQDGELEINVNDDFYCKYYEKGGAE